MYSYSNCKRLREFEKIEISMQAVELTVNVNSKEENSYDFCLDFVREFGLSTKLLEIVENNTGKN